MLLEQVVVVVTCDEVDDRLLRASGDAVRVNVPLTILRGLRGQPVRGKRADELGGELDGVHELALGRSGVHREAANGHAHRRCGERLGLQLSERRSVEGVRDVRAEGFDVEVLGTAADLLVHGERHADRSSIPLGMPNEVRDRAHDLRDPGLVVGPEQGRSVAGDDVVADPSGELGQLLRVENLPRVAGKLDRGSVPRLVHDRRDAGARDVGGRVHVGDQPDDGRAVRARKPREHR